MARVVTLLGGESTGKTTLAHALAGALARQGVAAAHVPEHLRTWCEQHGRAPRADEQAALADEQARRTDLAARDAATQIVIADTSPLMVAIYSELYFNDSSLVAPAVTWQRGVDLTLVMGLDLPWVADGLFRDSAAVRDATDARLRVHLQAANIPFQSVFGQDAARTRQALRAVGRLLGQDLTDTDPAWIHGRHAWRCDTCSDPDCEHRLFSTLIDRPTAGTKTP